MRGKAGVDSGEEHFLVAGCSRLEEGMGEGQPAGSERHTNKLMRDSW